MAREAAPEYTFPRLGNVAYCKDAWGVRCIDRYEIVEQVHAKRRPPYVS